MICKGQFKSGVGVVIHVNDGHAGGILVRASGDASFLRQRRLNPLARSSASAFPEAARVAALECTSEQSSFG